MISNLLLIASIFVLGLALRACQPLLLQRLGSLTILGASYFGGWKFTNSHVAAAVCASSWLFLPWLELLTQIRRISLPIQRKLRRKVSFVSSPELDALDTQITEAQFEHVEDCGWDEGGESHFYRVYYKPDERLQTALCLIDQNGFSYWYLSLCSRGSDGRTWATSNYPFPSSLKIQPSCKFQLVRSFPDDFSELFPALLSRHREFLAAQNIPVSELAEVAPEDVQTLLQNDLETQIRHNLESGLLQDAGEGEVRYSWRGLLFIWLQTLREFIRPS